ncbi:MAG: hypothetical protein ACK559_41685, partial [bacterium]
MALFTLGDAAFSALQVEALGGVEAGAAVGAAAILDPEFAGGQVLLRGQGVVAVFFGVAAAVAVARSAFFATTAAVTVHGGLGVFRAFGAAFAIGLSRALGHVVGFGALAQLFRLG